MNKTKSIKSKNGNLEVRYGDVTHVCIAPNTYPLIQYLLLMDDDIIFHHTYYFLNDTVPERMRSNLPCYECKYINKSIKDKILKRIHKIKFRFLRPLFFPFMKTAEIYAFDLPYISICIGKRPYQLLSDGPNWLTLNMRTQSKTYHRQLTIANSLRGKVDRFVLGDLYIYYFGNNKQCKAIHLTEENQSPVLEGKEVFINSFSSLWLKASERKKSFIKNLLDVTDDDIRLLSSKPYIYFSQPLVKDCDLTEEEYVVVLEKIFKNYSMKDLIIKTHPRDHFDYKKYFPEIEIYTKSVNSQILSMMGLTPKKVITIFSTAVEAFPESVECDYYGTWVHPKVAAFFGEDYKPNRKVNFVELPK